MPWQTDNNKNSIENYTYSTSIYEKFTKEIKSKIVFKVQDFSIFYTRNFIVSLENICPWEIN